MAAYNKFQPWAENLVEVANCGSDLFTLALTAAANAPVNTNAVLADLTQISYTNLSSRDLTTSSSTQSGGTYSLVLADLVLTASGGAVATFRYVVCYDNTPTSPADPLVCWHDYGGNVTLADGETFTYDLGSSLFTVA
jgi:hypothetical protein